MIAKIQRIKQNPKDTFIKLKISWSYHSKTVMVLVRSKI